MPILNSCRTPGVLLLILMLGGCAIYEKYGYGRVVDSKLDHARQTPVVLPANAPTISQRFFPRDDPSLPSHRGFDILVPTRTPVLAASDGVVSRVKLSMVFGKQVMIDHDRSAEGYRLQTRYFHLTEQLVQEGQRLIRGQLLGYSGMTGLAGGFPHLHFEVHRLDDSEPPVSRGFLDPQLFWADGIGRISCYDSSLDYPATPAVLTYPVPCRGVEWRSP